MHFNFGGADVNMDEDSLEVYFNDNSNMQTHQPAKQLNIQPDSNNLSKQHSGEHNKGNRNRHPNMCF